MNFSCPGDPLLSSSYLVCGDDVFACLESAEDDVSRRRHPSDDLDDTSDGSVFEYIIKAGDDLGRRFKGKSLGLLGSWTHSGCLVDDGMAVFALGPLE